MAMLCNHSSKQRHPPVNTASTTLELSVATVVIMPIAPTVLTGLLRADSPGPSLQLDTARRQPTMAMPSAAACFRVCSSSKQRAPPDAVCQAPVGGRVRSQSCASVCGGASAASRLHRLAEKMYDESPMREKHHRFNLPYCLDRRLRPPASNSEKPMLGKGSIAHPTTLSINRSAKHHRHTVTTAVATRHRLFHSIICRPDEQ